MSAKVWPVNIAFLASGVDSGNDHQSRHYLFPDPTPRALVDEITTNLLVSGLALNLGEGTTRMHVSALLEYWCFDRVLLRHFCSAPGSPTGYPPKNKYLQDKVPLRFDAKPGARGVPGLAR